MPCEVGTQLGPYRLTAECGSGAYGRVFVAENTLTGQLVALKVISGGGRQLERELQGLIRYRSCSHPNLLTVHHIDRLDGGSIYYTMDLADNLADSPNEYLPDTLAKRLEQRGPLSAECVRKLAEELLDGLEALHRLGLVHRDVKPDNILWIGGQAVLSDIGLVTEADAVSFAGTPGFLSPELSAGKRSAAPRDDFYALGKKLYCALTGEAVGSYPSFPKKLLSGSSRQLAGAIFKACGTPGFESAAVFRMALEKASAGQQKHRYFWAGAVMLVVVGVGLGGVALWRQKKITTSAQPRPSLIAKPPAPIKPPPAPAPNSPEPPPGIKRGVGKISDIPEITERWPLGWGEKFKLEVPAFFEESNKFFAHSIFDYPIDSSGERFTLLNSAWDWQTRIYKPNVTVSRAGKIRYGYGTTSTPSAYPALEKTRKLYREYYHPEYSRSLKMDFSSTLMVWNNQREMLGQSPEEFHEEHMRLPMCQLIFLEINIHMAVAAMLLDPPEEWDVLAERFRWLCERRQELIAYYNARRNWMPE